MFVHPSNLSSHEQLNWETVRMALRAAEEGVYCWNIGTGEISYTEQCLHMMGVSFDQVAPNVFTEPERTIHEKDQKFFKSELQRYLQRVSNTPMRIEIRLRNLRSRGWRWVRINGLLRKDKKTKALQLVGVWIDITRRKMADMHAMEDRDLFRTLINYLPDSIYFKNKQSRFVVANDSTAKKMGVPTPADLIGCTDRNFFDESMCTISRREELEIMETGIPIIARLHRETWKGKQSTWSQISKFPWISTKGEIKGIVGISSDVTRLMLTQQKYQKIANEMDARNKALEHELLLAREIQIALQPLRIRPRSYDTESTRRSARFHHVYRPSAGVAGDCFAVFPVKDSGVGMLICDVMGHGMRAALIASMLRGLMEQAASLANTPALMLSSLNRQLFRIFAQANITMFTTACYVYLDLEKGRLTLSNAGHPAPIVIDSNQHAYLQTMSRSPALGLMENTFYKESEIELQSGLKLMLYTDGLTEARNAQDDELGSNRILDYLNSTPSNSISEMIDNCLLAMNKFIDGQPVDDDICLLGMEFSEEGLNISHP